MIAEPAEIDGLTGLRQIDPLEADITTLVLQMLDGQSFGADDILSVKRCKPIGSGWFETASGASFHISKANGKTPLLDPSRIDDAVAALEDAEIILDRIEPLLGIALEPTALSAAAPPDSLVFEITARQHRMRLALPATKLDLDHLREQAAAMVPAIRHMPCIFEMAITAADLEIDEAADLAAGDLIIITAKPKAQLVWPNGIARGSMDFADGSFVADSWDRDEMSTDRTGGFTVPVTIGLPPQMTSAATLAGLRPGATMMLGPITNSLQVSISIGGRQFATGELVQIGNQFAVLIEERTDIDDLRDSEAPIGEEVD
jgi:Type III flagellar switch regulator (C-ring) FliN C-term